MQPFLRTQSNQVLQPQEWVRPCHITDWQFVIYVQAASKCIICSENICILTTEAQD